MKAHLRETKQLKELGKIITGRTPPTVNPAYFGDLYPFITPTDMDGRKVISTTERYLSDAGAKLLSSNLIPPESILVSCIGWQMGKSAMTSRKSFTNQQINALIPNKHINAHYLYYVLTTMRDKIFSYGSATGVRTPILNKTAFSDLTVSLPLRNTQDKVASILSAYDALIENTLKRIKILETVAQMIYKEWFVNFRFPRHDEVKMVKSELGLIPEGWNIVRVKDIIERIPAGKKYEQKTVKSIGSVPVLDQGRSGIIGYHDDKPGVVAYEEKPAIVFANHTCYQKLIQYPFSAIQNVLPFVSNQSYLRNIYWLHWATKDLIVFNDYKGHWPEFTEKKLLLPTLDICEEFGNIVKHEFRLIYRLEKRNQILIKTRDLLLPKLISGEINVENLDINTENLN